MRRKISLLLGRGPAKPRGSFGKQRTKLFQQGLRKLRSPRKKWRPRSRKPSRRCSNNGMHLPSSSRRKPSRSRNSSSSNGRISTSPSIILQNPSDFLNFSKLSLAMQISHLAHQGMSIMAGMSPIQHGAVFFFFPDPKKRRSNFISLRKRNGRSSLKLRFRLRT